MKYQAGEPGRIISRHPTRFAVVALVILALLILSIKAIRRR